MATVIRLSRMGSNKRPFFRIVVADSRKKKEGRIVERIGYYQQTKDPVVLNVDSEKALGWLKKGAVPSDTVKQILKKAGVWKVFSESKNLKKAV